jgi:hypothetical protein
MDPLESLVRHRLAEFRRTLGPHLAFAFDTLLRRLKFYREDSYILGPAAQPVLQMSGWVEASGEVRVLGGVLEDVAAAAAFGYLHVRLQDDLLDEATGDPAVVMMLSDVLFARHSGLLLSAVGHHREFWALFEEVWSAYAEASLLEHDLFERRSGYDEAAFAEVQRRSHPLLLPGAAVLVSQGRWQEIGGLREFVVALVAAHQRFHDLVDAQDDLRFGNPTFIVQRFGGEYDVAAQNKRLFLEGGFDEVIGEVRADLDRAARSAEALGMTGAVEFVRQREELITRTQQSVFRSLFEQILESGNGEPGE